MSKPFTGRHMAIILISFFGVVIAVNVVMARLATSTFGGTVVDNTYVASQHFNRWLDEADRQNTLGWSASLSRSEGGKLAVRMTGAPAYARLTAVARHPLGHAPDQTLTFSTRGDGTYRSQERLPAGRWIIRLSAQSGSDVWKLEESVS